jgi:glycosyltransferase involved in cell wall biosynthesis
MTENTKTAVAAKVAIITRTKDREIILRRTAACVMAQTYPDIVWVVVNDGGAREHVDSLADSVRDAGREVIVVHHEKSMGRPAAANAGIRANGCPWLMLLDDDDTIAPLFVERCMDSLEQSEFPCAGVAVWSDIVHERICEDKIVITATRPGYHPTEASFITLLHTNPFPPASFVFSRKGWEAAGCFDERLNCSEDWNFNQRLLIEGQIGIIPEVLAFVHHRVDAEYKDSAYANTMVHGLDAHYRYYLFWRDELIRNELRSGRLGLGQLNLFAFDHHRILEFITQTHALVARIDALVTNLDNLIRKIIAPLRAVVHAARKVSNGLKSVLKKLASFLP